MFTLWFHSLVILITDGIIALVVLPQVGPCDEEAMICIRQNEISFTCGNMVNGQREHKGMYLGKCQHFYDPLP